MIVTLTEENSALPGASKRTLVVDLSTLDGDAARNGRLTAEQLMSSHPLTPVSNPRARDTVEGPLLTIDHDGRKASYSADATSVSREFADVLKWVKLQPAARSRGGGSSSGDRSLLLRPGDTLVRGASRNWIVGARELLHALANRAFRVGILSNTGNLQSRQEILDLLPVDFNLSLFEPGLVLFSSEVGLAKPNPEIFKEATRRAGIPARRCFYCFESIPETLVAQHAGMLGVRVQPPPGGDLVGWKSSSWTSTSMWPVGRSSRHESLRESRPNPGCCGRRPGRPRRISWGVLARRHARRLRRSEGLRPAVDFDWRRRRVQSREGAQGRITFGADSGNPDADFNRMPSGLPPVPPAEIAFIEEWIDTSCPESEGEVVPSPLVA